MTWQDRLKLGAISCVYFAHISGVRYLPTSRPLPAAFLDTNGRVSFRSETYIPSNTLQVEAWTIEQTLQPMMGLPVAAQLNLGFRQPGTSGGYATAAWPDLLAVGDARDDGKHLTRLLRDIPPEGGITSIRILRLSSGWVLPWTATDDLVLHVGREAIRFRPTASASKVSKTKLGDGSGETVKAYEIDGMQARGAYGSVIEAHVADLGTAVAGQATGALKKISEYPRSFGGRYLELFGVLGRTINGEFRPFGTGLGDAETIRFFSGVIQAANRGGTLMEPSLTCTSIDSRLAEPIVQRAPTVTVQAPGATLQNGAPFSVRVDRHNKYVFASTSAQRNQQSPAYTELWFREQPNSGDQIIFAFPGISTTTTGTTTYTFEYRSTPSSTFHIPIGADIKGTVNGTRSVINRELGAGSVVAGLPAWHKALQVERPNNRTLELRWGNASVFTPPEYGVALSAGFGGVRAFLNADSLAGTTNAATDTTNELVRSTARDGSPPFTEIPEGTVLNLNDLAEVIGDSITRSLGEPYRATCQLSPTQVDPSDASKEPESTVKTQMFVTVSGVSDPETFTLNLNTRAGGLDSILRDVGFTDPLVDFEYDSSPGNTTVKCSALSEKGVPIFRWPPFGGAQPRTLTVRADSQWSSMHFNDLGWQTDGGDNVSRFAIIDDTIILSTSGIAQNNGRVELQNIRVSTVPPYNNDLDEELYIEWKEDEDQVVVVKRVLALTDMTIGRALLYVMLGGSGGQSNDAIYDQGWPGCGLLIPGRMINTGLFEALAAIRPELLDNLIIQEGDTGQRVIGDLCLEHALQIAHALGELYPVVLEPPTQSVITLSPVGTTHRLSQRHIVTDLRTGVGYDDGEGRIANQLKARAGLKNHSGKTRIELTVEDGDSIAEFGRQSPLQLTIRGQYSVGDVAAIGRKLQGRIVHYLGRRRVAYEIDVADYIAWMFIPGDTVLLTHEALPALDYRRTRSVTDLPVRVFKNRVHPTGKKQGREGYVYSRVTLVDYGSEGPQRGDWVPTMVIAFEDGQWRAQARAFSDPGDSLEDGDYFVAGYRIRAHPYGNPTGGFTEATIDSVTQESGHSRIFTFSETIGAGTWIVSFAPHDNAALAANQRTYTYLSDDNAQLRLPGGALNPGFVYV